MAVEEKVDPMLTEIKSEANSAKNSVQKVANDGLETVKFEAARAMRKVKGEGVDNGEIGALSAEESQIDGRARRIEREVDPIEREAAAGARKIKYAVSNAEKTVAKGQEQLSGELG